MLFASILFSLVTDKREPGRESTASRGQGAVHNVTRGVSISRIHFFMFILHSFFLLFRASERTTGFFVYRMGALLILRCYRLRNEM